MNNEIKSIIKSAHKTGEEVGVILENVSLSNYNGYRTGGKAQLFYMPESIDELKSAVIALKNEGQPYFILGCGSNVLVSDKGYNGVVISTLKLNKTEIIGSLIICECGAKLNNVISEMALNSFCGLEFAVGIPASVGGAVAMNAGCFSKNVGDTVCYVVTESGIYKKDECGFGYRTSRFLLKETALKICFNMKPCEYDVIEERIKTYKSFRKNPKGKTCGSVFKNDGMFAGKVIDEAGLKGVSVGKAAVSNEHANFIVSDGASAQDIYNLIKLVKRRVYEERQITLTEEVIYLGEFE